jgi:hypothetical protein
MRTFAVAAMCSLLLGCATPALPSSPAASPGQPPVPLEVANRTPLPSCGTERATTPLGPWNQAGRNCFLLAYREQRPAEFTRTRLTSEGDPITSIYRIIDRDRVEVFIDSTQDRFGSGGWQRLNCLTLTIVQAPAPDFGPDNSCAETPLS